MEPISDDLFAEGLQLNVEKTKTLVKFGAVNPAVLAKFDIDAPLFYAEFDVKTLIAKSAQQNKVHYAPVPKFPAVKRDLALLVDTEVTFAQKSKHIMDTLHILTAIVQHNTSIIQNRIGDRKSVV